MKSVRGLAAGALAAALAVQPALAQEKAANRAARDEALAVVDVWLDGVQAYKHLPALSAAVVVGQEQVWAKGYGTIDAKHTIKATPQTIYSICSISKLFTSVALMQQWEQGKVRLDDPITEYLPWAKLKPLDGDAGTITLRGALTHSAGLPREADYPYWTGPKFPFPTREEVRSAIAGQTPLYPSGSYFQYSNLGLTLVGETVEAVSKQPYADYAQAQILGPLGLKDTHPFMPMDLFGKRLAVGWGALKRDGTREIVAPFETRGITPAAGYTSTVEDLGKFASWQFRLLKTGKAEVLKASTLREMQRVQFMSPDWKTSWGLGFETDHVGDKTYVGHGGSCPGYHTNLTMRPADETAVVMMATGSEAPDPFARVVFALLDKRAGFKFKDPAPATGVRLADYVGHYDDQPWGSEVVVMPWAGGLAVFDLPSDNPAPRLDILKPKGGDVFRRVRDDGSEAEDWRFKRDAAGKVVGMVHFSNESRLMPTAGETR